jgi:hypothetical protein
MTDQEFCKIESAISGEEIDKVEQLTHCTFTGRELKEYLEQAFVIYSVSNSKRFERQDLLRAYQAGAIEQKDNDLKSIDVVTLGNLQEDSQVWYERYIG